MPVHELAALGAALCWSVTGLIAADAVRELGPFAFNRLRWLIVLAILAVIVLAGRRWAGAPPGTLGPIALSGLLGIFLGDMMLFMAMERLGPRRSGALFALNAPLAALAGWLFLGETLPARAVAGILLSTLGIALAVLGRPGRSGSHRFEAVRGPLGLAILFGILAAAGQAAGSLVARPAMARGLDPYFASLVRIAVAAAAQVALMALPLPPVQPRGRLTPRILWRAALSATLGMVVGMTLLMFALQGGKVGIVSTLSALSPVLILPTLWALTGARPSATSWLGALLAVAGMALIFLD